MSEGTDSSVPASEPERPESVSTPKGPPKGKGKKLWLMIVAVIVAVALIATALMVVPLNGGKKLTATIKGADTIEVDAGATATLTVVVKYGKTDVTNESDIKIRWSSDPPAIGTFSLRAKPSVPFVAGIEEASGTVTCMVEYSGKNVTVQKTLHVLPPFLDAISITPSVKTISPDGEYTFRAAAVSSVGLALSGIDFTWTATADTGVTYTMDTTTGSEMTLTVGSTLGNITLSASGTYNGVSKTGYANVTVGYPPPRSMDYVWYDMFNVPIQSWYEKRWEIYKQEEPWTTSYPWIFLYHSSPEGNLYTYTLMRLNITGKNVSEVNSNEKPEFLPILSPTERGGTIDISWYMQYLTTDELSERYGVGIANQDDGWIIDLNGTVTLDKQAAKMVMNLTDTGWDTFTNWWSGHQASFNQQYSDWLVSEAEGRVDIENAYESYYQLFTIDINAEKVGDKIVLTYDILTWGMEALMLRWLHECFLPMEEWYEDMHFNMKIMPEYSIVNIDTAVTYAAFAADSIDTPGRPVWAWEPLMGDAVPSSPSHPISLFDPYETKSYKNLEADSPLFGQYMSYDVVPAAWNLSDNETLKFEWPSGDQLFRYTISPGYAINVTDEMVVTYSEPMDTDFPGQIVADNDNNTLVFTGPIDMWDWSRNQSAHTFLQDEWGTVGLLPYGMPWVEFKKKDPVVIYLDHFTIDAAPSVPMKDWVTVTVTAIDNYGNVYKPYVGTINFTSDDTNAVLPANYTFNVADEGVHTFTGAIQFGTEGTKTLTVNVSLDTPLKTGAKTFTVLPQRAAASLQVDVYEVPSVGIPEDVTVSAIDQYGDLFLNYTGTVTFSTNRTGEVTLPGDYAFVLGDVGVHTIAAGLNFSGQGWYTITATDTVSPSVTGSQTNIWVAASPEAIDHFTVEGITDMLQNQKSDVTVTAYEQYGKVFKRYTGTIHFTANDTGGVFPADYTFLVSDEGVKQFDKNVAGEFVKFVVSQDTVFTVTVTDTVVPSATGSQTNILIQYKPPQETFTMYDLFQEPWHEWWPWRYPGYKNDIILTNESGKYTIIYNWDTRGQQGVIFAPYRWNITGTNMSQISIHSPEFMPVLGTPNVAGASASVSVYFEYLSTDWWNNYWSPVWHFPDSVMDAQRGDGWYPGVTYNVTMNRAAAEEWMGMPQTANPTTWWQTNAGDYIQSWEDWILNEGNNRLDIYNGYEWPYVDLGTKMKMSVLGNGDIYLQIGHLGEGYEILLTRWMNETGLCNHEPYYEDISLNVKYYSQWSDINFDAVCQYSLHAVKANESATNDGAWAWEPQLIDYVPSGNGHPSTYDPWASETYQSWNAGDPLFGQQVGYDSGLQYFNLTDYQTFVIKLPQGSDVLGYYGGPPYDAGGRGPIVNIIVPPAGSGYDRYPLGDGTNYDLEGYWPIMYNGSMSLGWDGNWTGPPNLDSMYDPVTNTITMVGPMRFDNTHMANGALYRGAPWIEFNVTIPAGGTSLPDASPATPASAQQVSLSSELMSLAAVISATSMAVIVLAACARRKI